MLRLDELESKLAFAKRELQELEVNKYVLRHKELQFLIGKLEDKVEYIIEQRDRITLADLDADNHDIVSRVY
jgi:uncharacterized coiled-coil protein SlyX